MSLISTLETIGKDVLKGIEIAKPVIEEFVPLAGPILTEVAAVITALEASGKTVTSDQITQIIQAVATISSVKQSAASAAAAKLP